MPLFPIALDENISNPNPLAGGFQVIPAHSAKAKVTNSMESGALPQKLPCAFCHVFLPGFAAFCLIFSFNCTLLSFSSPLTL